MSSIIKVFLPAVLSFFIGMFLSPIFWKLAVKNRWWKKKSRSKDNPDAMSVAFQGLHNEGEELSTPRIGGVVVWLSACLVALFFYLLSYFSSNINVNLLNFVSKNQTLIPILLLLFGAFVGLFEDFLQIKGEGGIGQDGTNYRWFKISLLIVISALAGGWFYYKLGMNSVHIPFGGELYLGVFFILFFIIVTLAIFSGSVIDGIDGLSGGVLAIIYSGYTFITISHMQYDLASLTAVISAALLAFLWFNIPPAKFYMGETGMLALTVCLSSITFLTNTVFLLPIIAFPLMMTSLSVIIQIISKKYFKKKVFRVAPLHHHFEAIGWPKHSVTMRYWIVSFICILIGVLVSIVS